MQNEKSQSNEDFDKDHKSLFNEYPPNKRSKFSKFRKYFFSIFWLRINTLYFLFYFLKICKSFWVKKGKKSYQEQSLHLDNESHYNNPQSNKNSRSNANQREMEELEELSEVSKIAHLPQGQRRSFHVLEALLDGNEKFLHFDEIVFQENSCFFHFQSVVPFVRLSRFRFYHSGQVHRHYFPANLLHPDLLHPQQKPRSVFEEQNQTKKVGIGR